MIREEVPKGDEIKETKFASEEVLGGETTERYTINVKQTP